MARVSYSLRSFAEFICAKHFEVPDADHRCLLSPNSLLVDLAAICIFAVRSRYIALHDLYGVMFCYRYPNTFR
jgi:hypothetical protein